MKRKRSAGRWVGKGWAYWTGTEWQSETPGSTMRLVMPLLNRIKGGYGEGVRVLVTITPIRPRGKGGA